MNTKLNIVVHGGFIQSVNDGQIHYISSHRLCNIYGLNANASNIIPVKEYGRLSIVNHNVFTMGFIHVYPRQDGKYSLFKLLFRR